MPEGYKIKLRGKAKRANRRAEAKKTATVITEQSKYAKKKYMNETEKETQGNYIKGRLRDTRKGGFKSEAEKIEKKGSKMAYKQFKSKTK